MRPVPSEARQHFVGNQQHAETITQTTDAGEKFARPDDHAARALQHRFDNHRRRTFAETCERPLQIGQAVDPARSTLEAERTAVAVRRVRPLHLEQQRRERRVKIESSLTDIAPTVSPWYA
jgi:hypothetical protein